MAADPPKTTTRLVLGGVAAVIMIGCEFLESALGKKRQPNLKLSRKCPGFEEAGTRNPVG